MRYLVGHKPHPTLLASVTCLLQRYLLALCGCLPCAAEAALECGNKMQLSFRESSIHQAG
ncbi:MAG: hypothetical protein AB1798_18355 [Spirochaetota bacterium]